MGMSMEGTGTPKKLRVASYELREKALSLLATRNSQLVTAFTPFWVAFN
jgi:hypothetical protein